MNERIMSAAIKVQVSAEAVDSLMVTEYSAQVTEANLAAIIPRVGEALTSLCHQLETSWTHQGTLASRPHVPDPTPRPFTVRLELVDLSGSSHVAVLAGARPKSDIHEIRQRMANILKSEYDLDITDWYATYGGYTKRSGLPGQWDKLMRFLRRLRRPATSESG